MTGSQSAQKHDQGQTPSTVYPRHRRWMAAASAVVAGVLLVATGVTVAQGVLSTPRAAAATSTVADVQALYAEDLVSRINAERAARDSLDVTVPQLQVDPGLEAYAQSWSAHLAATGTVADPALPACSGTATQVCIFAANSGDSGNGFWPGDGSDGMNGEYMASAPHRQNELGAGYTNVGVGVTCSGGQAWTVEVFGYTVGDESSALGRQAAQNAVQGQPVPATPVVAGAPSGDPVYCPGQTIAAGGTVTADGGQYPYPYRVPAVAGEPNTPAPVVGMASTADGGGYWLARSDGSISPHGDAASYGSMAGTALAAPVSHIVATPNGGGYWMVAADGGIFSFGDAAFYGSMGGKHLNAPVVGMAPTHDGGGYWLVASDGGIFSFGDANFQGSMGGQHLNAPVVGMTADAATGGYWLVASDGGIFSFDAPFYGSTGNLHLNRPVNGMASTADGLGYWFVASDGGIFSYGDARFQGSAGAMTLNAPIVGMATDGTAGGYWLVGSDGGVFSFGATFYGAD
jgi:uncharacterized protein YkwD